MKITIATAVLAFTASTVYVAAVAVPDINAANLIESTFTHCGACSVLLYQLLYRTPMQIPWIGVYKRTPVLWLAD